MIQAFPTALSDNSHIFNEARNSPNKAQCRDAREGPARLLPALGRLRLHLLERRELPDGLLALGRAVRVPRAESDGAVQMTKLRTSQCQELVRQLEEIASDSPPGCSDSPRQPGTTRRASRYQR